MARARRAAAPGIYLSVSGFAALWQGDFDLARARFEHSQSMWSDLQDVAGLSNSLWAWAQLFAAQGQYEHAVRLSGARDATQRVTTMDRLLMDRRLDAVRGTVGADLVDAALAEGSALSLDAAIAYVHQAVADLSPRR